MDTNNKQSPLMIKARCLLIITCAALPRGLLAKTGGVNYTWGAEALATMHDFVVTLMLSTLQVCYTIGSIVAIISALQIYMKMNAGEEGVTKSITMLVGAALFIIGASIVLPAFFGYRI